MACALQRKLTWRSAVHRSPKSRAPLASRHRSAMVSCALLLGLLLSACSGGGATSPAPTTGTGSAATSAPAAAQKPTPNQPTGTPATSGNAASQPAAAASGQPEQRSVQAGGDTGVALSDAPAAPIVARSKTTGRPITLEVWLTDWEQSTQQLFNDQLVPAYEAANPDTAVNIQYLDWRVFTDWCGVRRATRDQGHGTRARQVRCQLGPEG